MALPSSKLKIKTDLVLMLPNYQIPREIQNYRTIKLNIQITCLSKLIVSTRLPSQEGCKYLNHLSYPCADLCTLIPKIQPFEHAFAYYNNYTLKEDSKFTCDIKF